MDNVIEALGRGKNKQGRGLKEVKDKVVNYVKKNKGKIAATAVIGAIALKKYLKNKKESELMKRYNEAWDKAESSEFHKNLKKYWKERWEQMLKNEKALIPFKKDGSGLKERAIKIKDAIVNFIKKNKKIIIAGFMAGTLGSVYNNWDEFKKAFSKPTQTELDAMLNKIYKEHIPSLYKEDPRRPDPAFVEEIREEKSGRGFEEIKDKTVQFIKNHKGKLKTAATLGLLALAYNKGDKIIDYIDKTKLGQTETGQKILGNLGYATGHFDVYKGVLQHLWDKYRAEKFGRGKQIYILGAGIKDFWKKHKDKIKKAAKLAIIAYNINKVYQNWDAIKTNFKYGKVVYDMQNDLQQDKDLDIDKYVSKLADVFPKPQDKTLQNGAVLFEQTLRDVFRRNIVENPPDEGEF